MLCYSATTENQEKLSDLSNEDSIAFLETHGIAIPETYSEDMSWMPFVRFVIKKVESDPNAEFAFGYSVALDFAYKIKDAVNEYYSCIFCGVHKDVSMVASAGGVTVAE